MQGAWVFRRLVNFEKGAFWLCDYLVVDWLEVLQELGHVLGVDVDGDVKADTLIRCHGGEIENWLTNTRNKEDRRSLKYLRNQSAAKYMQVVPVNAMVLDNRVTLLSGRIKATIP
jgi:hypothetical protein